MPNRILKESITTSDTLPKVSLEAETLFYRLIVRVDDFGRYHGEPHLIYAHCLSNRIGQLTVEQVEEWLWELAEAGLLRRYESGGRPYVELTTFGDHNPRRATASKFPEPPPSRNRDDGPRTSACNCTQMPTDACDCEQAQADSPVFVSVFGTRLESECAREGEAVDNSGGADPDDAEGTAPVSYAQFMAAFPKRQQTARAWQAWCAEIAAGANSDEVVQAAKHYAEMVRIRGTPPRYVKLPATFLEQGMWRDYVSGIPEGELDEKQPQVDNPATEPPKPKTLEYDPDELARRQARIAQLIPGVMEDGDTRDDTATGDAGQLSTG